MLDHLGAIPIPERVVRDRNRITGAGVTSGIDFALTLAAELFGADEARRVQLALEYDPAPPFDHGAPAKANPDTVADITADTESRRMPLVLRAAAALTGNSDAAR